MEQNNDWHRGNGCLWALYQRADAVFTASWLKEEAKRGKLVRQRNKRAKHTEKHIASADGCENAAESVDNGRWHNADRPKSPT